MCFFKKFFLAIIALCFCFVTLQAQNASPVNFSFSKQRTNNNEVWLIIKAVIQPGIKLYAVHQNATDAVNSSVAFDSVNAKFLQGSIIEKTNAKTETDATLNAVERFFIDSACWQQKIKLNAANSLLMKGTISFMYKDGDEYKPGEENIRFFIQPSNIVAASSSPTENTTTDKSLLWIFVAAFGGGLLALLTPCVYSMIPITVSFFTKRSKTKSQGIRNALYYAVSIIIIFTLLGFLITLIFGPAALNNLATNWIANLIFFALFIIFGISFLGAFEITLPTSWTNKSDSKANTGNFLGIFFMALTLVLVSFSCTGPIIGNLLVLAAKGNYWGPLTGMFGFSSALALPFALFAFFPGKLNVLGKAGGWLNAVKVTLGFLELALALKFLSNADLVKGWRLLDREVFLSLWIIIFALLGIYLLGKLKFHHDGDLPKNHFGVPFISITRLFFSIIVLSFTLYMLPGLWGAPLKAISAFVPPMGTQDFTLSTVNATSSLLQKNIDDESLPHPEKYYAAMKMYEPDVVVKYGMTTYFDYDEALNISRKLHKPLMLDFTGINCVNCRKMEGQVWSDPVVIKTLKEDFVIVSLYVDVQNIDLQQNEIYYSKALGKEVTTLGDKNADMQVTKFGANSQPYYFFIDGSEKRLAAEGYGYNPDVQKFITHLSAVKDKYRLSQQPN